MALPVIVSSYVKVFRTGGFVDKRFIAIVAFFVAAPGTACAAHSGSAAADRKGEWRWYGGTPGGQKYAPLDQINANNVSQLKIVWRQAASPPEVLHGREALVGGNFENTPLMVGGLLFMRSEAGPVVALDASTGRVVWADSKAAGVGSSRGVAYWTDGKDGRVFALDGSDLIALNAKTGERYADFGSGGRVDLMVYPDARPNSPVGGFSWTSFPAVVGDTVVIAGVPQLAADKVPAGIKPALDPPGDIRGYDARSGKLIWTFHVIPRKGEYGYDSWNNNSADVNGLGGSWTWLSADEELGYVYIPTEEASDDFYGGARPGNDLFTNSVLCLDAKTGKRVWHYQIIHHDLWDMDNPTPPVMADITVDGHLIKALVQLTKQAYAYVLDRRNGKPVWPIVERPFPAGYTPGEWYSPTQPIPSKPGPFELQNVTTDDLIDFTPELRAQAIELLKSYKTVPIYTPASPDYEIVMTPGTTGAANWPGASFDPDTGMLYVPVVRNSVRVILYQPKNSPLNYDRKSEGSMVNTNVELPYLQVNPAKPVNAGDPFRLPFLKPPYGSIVAIDLNKGEIKWKVPNGDGPKNHPLLQGLNLPPLGTPNRASPLLTKTLLFIGEGRDGPNGPSRIPSWGGGKKFRALDKQTGNVIWEMVLPGGTSGAPITYMANGKQFIVVALGWHDMQTEVVALALP
jgi:quinoprotein glucose dehydrogenase